MDIENIKRIAFHYSRKEDFHQIEFQWNGKFGQEFEDANFEFRIQICEFIFPQIEKVKIDLIRDLYMEFATSSEATWGAYMKLNLLGQEFFIREGTKYLMDYIYVGNNPLLLVDPNGNDWFYHSADGVSDPTWQWHDGSEYHTGVNDVNGNEVVLKGTEAVVVFEGSTDEQIGTNSAGRSGFINGEGAKVANVTVYGPDGANDIHHYKGYTMSSDPEKYGVVADGIYDANYDVKGKSGKLKSHWTLKERGHVPDLRGYDPYTGEDYVEGIFIHSSNHNGYAGTPVSKGCLLIVPGDWNDFNDVMDGVKQFKVQIDRDVVSRTTSSLLATKKVEKLIANVISGNYSGKNVTIPYKLNQLIIPFLK